MLAIVCLTVKPAAIRVQKYIYDHAADRAHVYLLGQKNPYQNLGLNMYFYRPKDFSILQLANYEQLEKAARGDTGHFLFITDHLAASAEQQIALPQPWCIAPPQWTANYNYFHWQNRTDVFHVYAVDAN